MYFTKTPRMIWMTKDGCAARANGSMISQISKTCRYRSKPPLSCSDSTKRNGIMTNRTMKMKMKMTMTTRWIDDWLLMLKGMLRM